MLQKKLEDEEARARVASSHHETYVADLRATLDSERKALSATREDLVWRARVR